MLQPLFVFDLDHTLISVDSSSMWSRYLVRQGIAAASDFLQSEETLMRIYASGQMDLQQYVSTIMKPLEKIPAATVDNIVDHFVATDIVPAIYPQARQLIYSLQQQGQKLLVISASVSLLVQAIARQLAITEAIGVNVAINNGYYSDHIQGIPSYQQGKVTCLHQWLQQQWLQHHADYSGKLTFYTDSINDLPLCQYADEVFLVNPCERLAQAGRLYHWQVLHWFH